MPSVQGTQMQPGYGVQSEVSSRGRSWVVHRQIEPDFRTTRISRRYDFRCIVVVAHRDLTYPHAPVRAVHDHLDTSQGQSSPQKSWR